MPKLRPLILATAALAAPIVVLVILLAAAPGALASCPAADQHGQPGPRGPGCDTGSPDFVAGTNHLYLPLLMRQTIPVTIVYKNFVITPSSNTIIRGQTVTFDIQAGPHEPYNFTGVDQFDSGPNLTNTTYFHTFTEVGTITLLCGYHANMMAQLTIAP